MNVKTLIGEDLPIAVAAVALIVGLAQAIAAAAYSSRPEPSGAVTPPGEAPDRGTSSSSPATADRGTSSSSPATADRGTISSSPATADRGTSSSSPATADRGTSSPAVASPAPSPSPPASAACPAIAIPFALGSAELDREARKRTQELAVWATAHPEATFVFDGHADARGDEIANLRLSKLRSSNVSAIFQSLKIDKSRLTARGFGTFVPAGGVAEDRRVSITILGGTCPPAEGVAR